MPHAIVSHLWMTINETEDHTPFVSMTPTDGHGTLVVALTDTGEVLILREWSPAYQRFVYFLPGGSVEEGEAVAESANRELQEEAGFKAERLEYVGEIYPFIKYLRGWYTLFIARDLQPSKLEGDEGYEIGVERMAFADLDRWIADGRLQDANVIAALYRARAFWGI